jgi:hypothetical protein
MTERSFLRRIVTRDGKNSEEKHDEFYFFSLYIFYHRAHRKSYFLPEGASAVGEEKRIRRRGGRRTVFLGEIACVAG